MAGKRISRRRFLKASAAAAGAFTIVPRHVLGGPGRSPPSEVITRGTIGTGGMGMHHVARNTKGKPPVQIAVCDVDRNHLNNALKKAGGPCKGYTDFRRVLDHKDIDVIRIATPPHWHALISIAAAQAGKDILCEKPMTRFIREGQAVADAVRRYGRVFQIGTYGRFGQGKLRKLIDSGLLGEDITVRVTRRQGYNFKVRQWSGRTGARPERVPSHLDYDMWLGPAPYKPYVRHRTHGSFRGYWDYDGGGLGDMGQHFLDPVQFFLNKDHASPTEVEARAPWPAHPDACGLWGRVTMRYEDGTVIILESGEWGQQQPGDHAFIQGSKGKVYKGNRTDPPGLFDRLRGFPDPPRLINFDTAVRTRRQPGGNAEAAHRCAALLHLANIAIRTGRKLRYDPVAQNFIADEQANRLVDVPMRAPWHL